MMDQIPDMVPEDHWGFSGDLISCPRSGEFDRSTGSNLLLSRPIPIQGVVGLTIDWCINNIIYDPTMYLNTEYC